MGVDLEGAAAFTDGVGCSEVGPTIGCGGGRLDGEPRRERGNVLPCLRRRERGRGERGGGGGGGRSREGGRRRGGGMKEVGWAGGSGGGGG